MVIPSGRPRGRNPVNRFRRPSERRAAASIREPGLKWRNGKTAIAPRRLAEQALANGLRPLPIELEALLSSESRQAPGDPFDRLLHAPARLHGHRLMRLDRTLAAFGAAITKPA